MLQGFLLFAHSHTKCQFWDLNIILHLESRCVNGVSTFITLAAESPNSFFYFCKAVNLHEGSESELPSRSPLLTRQHQSRTSRRSEPSGSDPDVLDVPWSQETRRELLGSLDQQNMCGRKNEADAAENNHPQWSVAAAADGASLLLLLWKQQSWEGQMGSIKDREVLEEEKNKLGNLWMFLKTMFCKIPQSPPSLAREDALDHSRGHEEGDNSKTWIYFVYEEWVPRFSRNAARSCCLDVHHDGRRSWQPKVLHKKQ